MIPRLLRAGLLLLVAAVAFEGRVAAQPAAATPATPAPASIDFARDVKPILAASCVRCHARGKARGGFSIESREALLAGGDSGIDVVPGKSGESRFIALVDGTDPDEVMPKKGSRLKPDQIAILRAWIDQGAPWDPTVSFARAAPRNLARRHPDLPAAPSISHPVDRLLAPYLAEHSVAGRPVDDRLLARRLYLDVLGLLPPPDELRAFIADRRTNKRERLVERLFADRVRYAEHWISFWNDALRNDYRGTGYIDGGRLQISEWLFRALVENRPYDRFVAELVNPRPASLGFTKGIVWRGVVNASQTPEMQAAQNIAQVFMGVNLKCASCHDSFINDWQLADAYGLAGVYADGPLQMVECDRPLRETAPIKFIYAGLGAIDGNASRSTRLEQLSTALTSHVNGRLSRTIVNRLWARFMGRGLVEPVDDMEQASWHPDLLDWLAEDLVANGYDLQRTMTLILTSDAYRMAAVDEADPGASFVFSGPLVRRLTAEQFVDAVSAVTGVWQSTPAGDFDFTLATREAVPASQARWIWAAGPDPGAPQEKPVYFRRAFTLRAAPALAQAVIAYDRPFVLHVNGKKVGEYRGSKNPRTIPVETLLRAGPNVLAIATSGTNSVPEEDEPLLPPRALSVQILARTRRATGPSLAIVAPTDSSWATSSVASPGWEQPGTAAGQWRPARLVEAPRETDALVARAMAAGALYGRARASLTVADPLMLALGRPTREQVITTRSSAATTLQSLELNNGETLATSLQQGAKRLLASAPPTPKTLVDRIYERALGRMPTAAESRMCRDLLGTQVRKEGVEDLLWAVTMLPEFQLIR